ncbi:hypothetical protein ACFYQQ_00940 [Streptomyces sp. NPDC005496]|uniref:hypothetical protein n=1 Tax=unclassified Streptomyces TaxID=2593676 RepID=UPI0033B5588E
MNRYPIDGPLPLTLRVTSDGADLDVSTFLVRAVFTELFQQAAEDPTGFGEEFAAMYELSQSAIHQGRDSHARHEFDERMDQLLKEYANEGRIPLYASGLGQLRDAAGEITAPRQIPGAREGGAAA